MKQVRLEIRSREDERSVALGEGRLTIGRGEEAEVRVSDPAISRSHAIFHRDGDRIWILDAGSNNGTYVNNRIVPASGKELSHGDVVRLGDAVIVTVRFDGQAEAKPDRRVAEGSRTRPALSLKLPVIALVSVFVIGLSVVGWRILRTGDENTIGGNTIENAGEAPYGPTPVMSAPPLMPATVPAITPEADDAAEQVFYLDMNAEQKRAFLERRAREIADMMGNGGALFDSEPLDYIQRYVDQYARRVGNRNRNLWGEDLNFLFDRAIVHAPHIIAAFRKESVPPVLGLYIPVIESEYRPCLPSPAGALGMFQFIASTARAYGVNPANRCDARLMAPAAALYMKDRIVEFGADAKSVALSIAGYNRDPRSVRMDLQSIIDSKNNERSFWTLLGRRQELDHYFQKENVNYVPKFFAAAIVGETPRTFKLRIRRLSSYDQPSQDTQIDTDPRRRPAARTAAGALHDRAR